MKIMTRLASYDSGEGREEQKTIRYNRKDYVSFHVLATAIWVTVGYIAAVCLILFLHMEYFTSHMNGAKLIVLAVIVIVGYAALLALYIRIAGRVYRGRYSKAKENARLYYMDLRRLNRLYEKERPQAGVSAEPEGEQ